MPLRRTGADTQVCPYDGDICFGRDMSRPYIR